jgi:ABC-2 type transport system permease protein
MNRFGKFGSWLPLALLLMAAGAVVLPSSSYGAFGHVTAWLPSGALGDAMRTACLDGGVAWRDLGVLLVWGAAGTVLTARTFRWE